ncbi:hypothetical protein A5880_002719 [Enterococcus sp. 4G2_DIV0659]|uniref:Uncharacterized protein n=1 Tax=Candidatus Enterococcus mansonii TaxID=1834181 RepID=A0A242CI64_9ENTE|nr:hypothetical protein A5880_000617 [Enterococcus sp. 4G2_DIV0659]
MKKRYLLSCLLIGISLFFLSKTSSIDAASNRLTPTPVVVKQVCL